MNNFFASTAIAVVLALGGTFAEDAPSAPKSEPLSASEKQILADGKIGTTRQVLGGLLGTGMGFGLGHVVTGQWLQTGWIFTTGELVTGTVALTALAYDDPPCKRYDSQFHCVEPGAKKGWAGPVMTISLVGFLGLRVWEIVDVWMRPAMVNDHVDELRRRQESSAASARPLTVALIPTLDGDHHPGIALHINF